MSVTASDISFKKSAVVTDTTSNGGRKGQITVVSGARHNLFPRVTKAERTAGVTRYRKEFWLNDNASDETAYDTLLYLEFPSNGGDRFYIGLGSHTNTQAAIVVENTAPAWLGVGSLQAALSGGETTVALTMENDDFEFPNGGYLHISDKFKTGQTKDSDVSIGDSVEYSGGTWSKITSTTDIDYPKGIYVGSNVVMTIEGATSEEWLEIADNLYEDEVIGTGSTGDQTPALATLTNKANGVCGQPTLLPVVTATVGSVEKTVNVAADGSCSGYCSAGTLNMDTGVWTVDITWTVAPDNGTDITITYRELPYSYSGNTVTVELESGTTVANAYTTAKTYGAGCINAEDVECETTTWTETSSSGTYDESTYPVIMFNDGTEYDFWTVTFTSAVAFNCSGSNEGSVGAGVVSSDFSPTNPETGQPYFTIDKDGWGGTWTSGDTVTFYTNPSAAPIWIKEVVPSSTAALSNNLTVLGYYTE
jgi:hypothetical protein